VIVTVTLRLMPRLKLRRLVDVLDIDDALVAVRRKVKEGCIYGDFQYAIDPADDSFLRRGVFACYAPAGDTREEPDSSADLKPDDWGKLLSLAHSDKRAAFAAYSQYYLSSHGRVYWSDVMQLSTYIPSYEQFLSDTSPHSLMIGELYVPPDDLPEFLAQSRKILREQKSEDIYGTIRAIQPDRTTFLPWAKRDYACVIFNLRTAHTDEGIGRTRASFCALNAAAIRLGGSYFLTYHRYASAEQVEQAYPRFRQFLERKRHYDPKGQFTSDWYRHYIKLFS
jgi:FAD/FMN-containing dehydrogenase